MVDPWFYIISAELIIIGLCFSFPVQVTLLVYYIRALILATVCFMLWGLSCGQLVYRVSLPYVKGKEEPKYIYIGNFYE